jgi:hypothetical protein
VGGESGEEEEKNKKCPLPNKQCEALGCNPRIVLSHLPLWRPPRCHCL